MSLSVLFEKTNPNVNLSKFEIQVGKDFNDLFGFESWRSELWGSEIVKTLGCKMLSRLEHTDIYAFEDDINTLKTDFLTVRQNVSAISTATSIPEESISSRVENALEKIRIALSNVGEVGIYIG